MEKAFTERSYWCSEIDKRPEDAAKKQPRICTDLLRKWTELVNVVWAREDSENLVAVVTAKFVQKHGIAMWSCGDDQSFVVSITAKHARIHIGAMQSLCRHSYLHALLALFSQHTPLICTTQKNVRKDRQGHACEHCAAHSKMRDGRYNPCEPCPVFAASTRKGLGIGIQSIPTKRGNKV